MQVIDEMVNRFLTWHLPAAFMPDGGVSFTPVNHPTSWPTGTNLLTGEQAKQMLEHVARDLLQMLADCDVFLKDAETPAQRIERERRDTEAVLNLLIREKQKTEAMTMEVARYHWLREHTAATGLSRWMGSAHFLDEAVDLAMGPNVEFSGVPAGHSSNHPAGGTSAGTQG